MRRYRRLKQEMKAHNEALRLRRQEEQRLQHQGNTRAKEIAEQNYRVSEHRVRNLEHLKSVKTFLTTACRGQNTILRRLLYIRRLLILIDCKIISTIF